MKYFNSGDKVIVSDKNNRNFGKTYTIISYTNNIDRTGREYCLYDGSPYKLWQISLDNK